MSKYFLEYIWVDRHETPRSKIRIADGNFPTTPPDPSTLPLWNFDGSSTDQNWLNNDKYDTEVVLKPVRTYLSPIDPRTILVLCQLDLEYQTVSDKLNGPPVPGFNTRLWASKIEAKYSHLDPWFGCEQEYTLLDSKTKLPFNFNIHKPQGDFYCSVKHPECQLSQMVREHLYICAEAGIKINGINAEVAPSQWEFQIGPAGLLKVADDMYMARYLLFRLSVKYGIEVTFHPKPMKGDWNGSGCHINFSTNLMRGDAVKVKTGESIPDCSEYINKAIVNLEKDHPEILKYYGSDNDQRLTGLHETSSMDKFTYGVGTRHTSVRIPNQVASQKYGYIEDRRPASNIDPYLALGKLLDATQT
tara:strand:- start:8058 stop:9137 length:1080 start_codon:yes stop_codon:yes gene_type:complete